MKKVALTLAIVLGMTVTSFADGGGLFQRGVNSEETGMAYGLMNRTTYDYPTIPNHQLSDNQDAAPLGSGIAVLIGLGAAYAAAKRRKEE